MARVSIKKRSVKKPAIPARPIIDTYDLPASYDSTYVTLIARDPYWMYAYWEIAPSCLEKVRVGRSADFEKAARVLRVYDVSLIDFNGSNAHRWFDLEVGQSNNWYINIWQDNTSFVADIGLRVPDGRFFTLARSNAVTTPRANQSHRSEHIWMEVKNSPSRQPFVVGRVHKTQEVGRPSESAKRSGRIYLSEDDIRAYYSKLSPLLRDVIAMRLAKNRNYGRRTTVSLKGSGSISGILIRGLSKRQFLKRILVGSSEELLSIEETEAASVNSRGHINNS